MILCNPYLHVTPNRVIINYDSGNTWVETMNLHSSRNNDYWLAFQGGKVLANPTQSQNKSNNRHLDLSQFNVFMVSDTQGDLLLKHKFIVSIIY